MKMSQKTERDATDKASGGFEPIASYERLIKLRATSPDAFMLQTSEATRRALDYYEAAKVRHEQRRVA